MNLTITTHATDLFIYPTPEGVEPVDPDDAILLAMIHLDVPADAVPRKLSKLTVTLVGNESLGFPSGTFEQQEVSHRSVSIRQAKDQMLEPGRVYRWEVTFNIPHSTAPYERSHYGRLYYKLVAKINFAGMFAKSISAEKNVFPIASPAPDGSLAYQRTHRDVADGLGPILLAVRTQHLTVGGYLRFALTLPCPSPILNLDSIELILVQTTILHSRVRPGYVQTCPPKRMVFLSATGKELRAMEDGEGGIEGDWVARLPDDGSARGSSLPGSDSAIKMAHELEVRLQYHEDGASSSKQSAPAMLYTASWPLTLPSCGCRYYSVRLPTYTARDHSPVPSKSRDSWAGTNEFESHDQCVCGDTLEMLLGTEAEAEAAEAQRLTEELAVEAEAMGVRAPDEEELELRGWQKKAWNEYTPTATRSPSPTE